MSAPQEPHQRPSRRGYLDWLRGLAVLIMIEAHVIDSWTRVADRGSWQFAWAMILGGFGAPLFLFLAGVSVALSAGSKSRQTNDDPAASAAVMKRGLEDLRARLPVPAASLDPRLGNPRTLLLKVDILNIMGPGIVAAAALWGRRAFSARTIRGVCGGDTCDRAADSGRPNDAVAGRAAGSDRRLHPADQGCRTSASFRGRGSCSPAACRHAARWRARAADG